MSKESKLPGYLSAEQVSLLCEKQYGIIGKISSLPGELDHNYKIETGDAVYVLKISRPGTDIDYLDYQEKLLLHIQEKNPAIKFPGLMKTSEGKYSFSITDPDNEKRNVRLLQWIPGRLWSSVNPQRDSLRYSLGEVCGEITGLLQGFNHPQASRTFDWNLAQAAWTYQHLPLFSDKQKECILFFTNQFDAIQPEYRQLRKSVIHNDANDNNIIVSDDLLNPVVETVIDYGDAVYAQTINDLAVTIAYAIMDQPDPLAAALPVVTGYHKKFSLQDEELKFLYVLIAMRLVISVTKSAINKINEPANEYLQISDRQAWALLYKWAAVPAAMVHYSFRNACGFSPVPNEKLFLDWTASKHFTINDLFPGLKFSGIQQPDLSIGSRFLGNFSSCQSTAQFSAAIRELVTENPDTLFAGGYLEPRPVYATDAFKKEGNEGPEYRTYHLGMDCWMKENTPVHAFYDGEVICCTDNAIDKDYGPTVILKHYMDENNFFYSLYGHLSKECLNRLKPGDKLKRVEKLALIGSQQENGNWPPHLHFQIILDLLGNQNNYPGVCSPSQLGVWSSLCPDPEILFNCKITKPGNTVSNDELIAERKKHLGKNLSLSYTEPLTILRGEMQWLISHTGRRYLDTVNNVAHVGHEHPRVVKAGQQQMAVLNTNTRYLHKNIIEFANELCKTLPEELSVIYFVNSGSEANELALRMAKTFTSQKDIIALETGYHGNTNGCIDISSYKFDGKGGKGKPEHTHIVPMPDSFRGKYRGTCAETGKLYADHVREKIGEIKNKERGVCAFIAESIMSCGGQIVLPGNYLKTAYAYVREAGGLCIADEVQVGFGRVGKKFWGFELQDVIPDIVTMGKPAGNGHPLAAVACTPAVANAFTNGMEYFNTFGGNPVSAAIGLEVLRVIKDEQLQENALVVGEYLKLELSQLQRHYPVIGDVRGEGLFLGIELTEPGLIPATGKTAYLAERMKVHGILMSVDGPQNNVLKVKPPMCFNKQNADQLLYYIEKTLKEDYIKI